MVLALKLVFCFLFASAVADAQVGNSVLETVMTRVIASTGGDIEIAGRVRVAFPAKFFSKPETVSVAISGNPTTDNALAGYELLGAGRGPYLSFDVLVEAEQEPQSDYEMTITLPSAYVQQ